MSMILDTGEVNRFNPRPLTNLQGGRGFGIRYPSPFFDVAQQFLPENVHQLHLWCRYYFFTNPIVNAACSKLAEYPVTRLIYDTEDEKVQKLYTGLENLLHLRQFQVEVGLDYFCMGNCFVSIWYPLQKYLKCKGCGTRYRAEKSRSLYQWKNQRFFLKCPACRKEDYAEEVDIHPKSIRDISLIRWNSENIEISHNEINGRAKYYYKLPRRVVNDIKLGDPDTIENLPIDFLEACRESKALLFRRGNFYHLKRPTIAQKDMGWGTPLIYPLLKDAFYYQVMKKSQEAIMMEHIVPLRVIYPGQNTGGNDAAFGAYNLSNWKAKIDAELNLWKRDHNYIPILPVNVGFQNWGGDAKILLMHQEMRMVAEQMLAGAGVPVEFVFGGLQWSATNTSLRALENMFLGYNGQRHELINDFVLGNIASFMDWPRVHARFDRFRMADDLQRSMFYLQLNQAQKISDRRLAEELGEDFDQEINRMGEELKRQLSVNRKMQVASADIQGEAQLHQSRYQAKALEFQTKAQLNAQVEVQQGMAQGGMQPPAGQLPGPQDAQAMQPPAPGQDAAAQGIPGQEPPTPADGIPAQVGGQPPQPDSSFVPNQSKVPLSLASPIQMGAGGVDLRYVAQRASSYLKTVRDEKGADAMYQEMEQMQTQNPSLYKMVIQLMQDTGSKVNPMDAQKAPAPAGTAQKDISRSIG